MKHKHAIPEIFRVFVYLFKHQVSCGAFWTANRVHLTPVSCVEHILCPVILLHTPLHSYYYSIIINDLPPSRKNNFFYLILFPATVQ